MIILFICLFLYFISCYVCWMFFFIIIIGCSSFSSYYYSIGVIISAFRFLGIDSTSGLPFRTYRNHKNQKEFTHLLQNAIHTRPPFFFTLFTFPSFTCPHALGDDLLPKVGALVSRP